MLLPILSLLEREQELPLTSSELGEVLALDNCLFILERINFYHSLVSPFSFCSRSVDLKEVSVPMDPRLDTLLSIPISLPVPAHSNRAQAGNAVVNANFTGLSSYDTRISGVVIGSAIRINIVQEPASG